MELVQENQILLYEELCAKPVDEDDPIVKATRLFKNNIRLANGIAMKMGVPRDPVIDREVILQLAYEGLWRACLSYDESLGFKFSTYAVPHIRGRILREMRDTEALKTPRQFKDIRSALSRHQFTLPLNDEEIDVLVSEGKISRKQIMEYAEVEIYSFEHPIGEDDSMTLSEVIEDTRIGRDYLISEDIEEERIENLVDNVLVYIKPIHRDMVEEWLYATIEGEHINQVDLGRKYGKSQVHVSRVLSATIAVLKMHRGEILDSFGY